MMLHGQYRGAERAEGQRLTEGFRFLRGDYSRSRDKKAFSRLEGTFIEGTPIKDVNYQLGLLKEIQLMAGDKFYERSAEHKELFQGLIREYEQISNRKLSCKAIGGEVHLGGQEFLFVVGSKAVYQCEKCGENYKKDASESDALDWKDSISFRSLTEVQH